MGIKGRLLLALLDTLSQQRAALWAECCQAMQRVAFTVCTAVGIYLVSLTNVFRQFLLGPLAWPLRSDFWALCGPRATTWGNWSQSNLHFSFAANIPLLIPSCCKYPRILLAKLLDAAPLRFSVVLLRVGPYPVNTEHEPKALSESVRRTLELRTLKPLSSQYFQLPNSTRR